MKYRAVALILLVALSMAAGRRGSDPAVDVRALLGAQQAAWNRGDLDGFMQAYWKSRETAFVGSNGITRGWQPLLEHYRKSYPDRKAMGTLNYSEIEITPLGLDAALILGRWQLTREEDSPGGVFTLVARHMPEGWRIVCDHTSLVKPSAARP